jgi:SAM-dependent methyltransferase
MNTNEASCPICTSEEGRTKLCLVHLGSDREYGLLECGVCGARFVDPMPTQHELGAFYHSQYYGKDWYKQLGSGMAFAKKYLTRRPPGRFLDIGCGMGYFIEGVARNSSWEVFGTEFGEKAAEYARNVLHHDVRHGDLVNAAFPDNSFDYIQIRNVLEHVTDPVELLAECRRVIKPDGTLHLFVPNGSADSADLINFYRSEGEAAFSKSGHLFFFPRRTLDLLIDKAGFSLARGRTFGIRRGLKSLGRYPRFKDWKKHYRRPAKSTDTETNGDIVLPPGKQRPDIYYKFRLLKMNAGMWPGLTNTGLDFELILKPKSIPQGGK